MNLKQQVEQKKNAHQEVSDQVAKLFKNKVISKLYDLVTTEDLFSFRWLMVHLDTRNSLVEIRVAVREFEIVNTPRITYNLFEDEVAIELKNTTASCQKLYKRKVFNALRLYLEEQGFENIGNEIPFEVEQLHTEAENFEWFALEV